MPLASANTTYHGPPASQPLSDLVPSTAPYSSTPCQALNPASDARPSGYVVQSALPSVLVGSWCVTR